MKNTTIVMSLTPDAANVLLRHKEEGETLEQAAQRIFYERLNMIDNLTEEQLTLESISSQLSDIRQKIFNIGMRVPLQPF